jgi:MFS family permease
MGRKRANQMAVFFAALGILACGLSTSMEMLIAARFVRFMFQVMKRCTLKGYYYVDRRSWWWRYIHHVDVSMPLYIAAKDHAT